MDTELTFGEKAVGLTFNPSADKDVHEIKCMFALVIDRLNTLREDAKTNMKGATGSEKVRMYSVAITEAQTACMWSIKAVTWSK